MSTIKFTDDHEWVRVEEDGSAVVGITDFAQEKLGELVFVELPEADSDVTAGDSAAVIESVKAASDLHSPVSGKVTAVNEALEESPEMANEDPMGEGWFYKLTLSDPSELDKLMDEASYTASLDD